MNKKWFRFIGLCVLIASFLFTIIFGCDDRPGLFIACLGSFATIATLYVAYEIFLNYSATADIQKKQFELVNSALEFFIKKHFTVVAGGTHYYCYFTKDRLEMLADGLNGDGLSNYPVIMSSEMFIFFYDLQNKMDHHFFPRDVRDNPLFLRPNVLAMKEKDEKDNIIIYSNKDDPEYGVPIMNFPSLTIGDFIQKWNHFRVTLQNFLNNQLQDKYKIVDE